MNIITLTLNPAFDVHCFSETFQPFSENLVKITAKDAGGKGINISRALAANGIESTAIAVLGDENADDFRCCFSSSKIKLEEIVIKGRIRENITLHTADSKETRISFEGFSTDDTLLSKINAKISAEIDKNTVLTFTGSLPKGITLEAVKKMLNDAKKKGARLVIDSKSFALKDLVDCGPWLIKPNDEEITQYTSTKISTLEEAAVAAESIRASRIENVMISLGKKGAVLASADGTFIASAPNVKVISTIGAGDSSIAGFLAAIKSGASYCDALKLAVCYGSAACMTDGTEPPLAGEVKALLENTKSTSLKRF